MIIKIQMPVLSNEENAPALVYNKDRSIKFFSTITKELQALMGMSLKKYFEADVDAATRNFNIKDEVNDPGW